MKKFLVVAVKSNQLPVGYAWVYDANGSRIYDALGKAIAAYVG